MAKKSSVYKCETCGLIAEVINSGAGELVCCAGPMVLQEAKKQDASTEKHVPYIEKIDNGYKVSVGQNDDHPMEKGHHIEWIELTVGDLVAKTYLDPDDDNPEASFFVSPGCTGCNGKVSAREYCNVHGLWKS